MAKNSADRVQLSLEDGRRIHVPTMIADRVRGIDADGNPLVPLVEPGSPLHHEDGAEYLLPLTPCCQASSKGAAVGTGVVCRACHREVDVKFGAPSRLAVHVTSPDHPTTASTTGSPTAEPPSAHRLLVLADELAPDPDTVDDIVHDVASSTASAINNAGLHEQVRYLLDELGETVTEQVLRAAAAPRTRR
jgi:hypothetical protein